jgi:glycosyltransferase involved in cell wall biosynthesis
MIDVHILRSRDTKPEWYKQCLSSVREAADNAGYPVNIHEVPGVPGHIGKARARGYSKGEAKWKTFVDDDDYVLPNAFQALEPHLNTGVAAIFPREYVEQNGKRHKAIQRRHHLQVYRADLINSFPHEDWVCLGDVVVAQLAQRDPRGFLDIDDVVYVHRIYYNSKARKLRREYTDEMHRLREMFNA